MCLHHHPGRGLPSPRLVVLLIRTRQPAGSIDSLIRVSRRAEGGPNATQAPQLLPSSHWPPAPAGGQAAARGPPSERVQPPWATARAPNREPRGSLARPETRPGVQPAQQPFSGCGGSVETPFLLLLCHHRHGPFLPCWATGCTRFSAACANTTIMTSLGPRQAGCHRGAAATTIHPLGGGLSGRPRAGPRLLGTGSLFSPGARTNQRVRAGAEGAVPPCANRFAPRERGGLLAHLGRRPVGPSHGPRPGCRRPTTTSPAGRVGEDPGTGGLFAGFSTGRWAFRARLLPSALQVGWPSSRSGPVCVSP